MELYQLPLIFLLFSNIHSGHAEDKPKAVVTVYPQHEPTTVRCELPGAKDDWTYSWFKDGSTQSFTADQEFSISSNTSKSSSEVTCRGERKSDGLKSESSDAVTVNLSYLTESPKAVLSVDPKASQIFRGDRVKLKCKIQGDDWKYTFECEGELHTSDDDEYKITVQFTQTCRCLGSRSSGSSEWSDGVTLTVSVTESPKAVLSVEPKASQIFRGDTVKLKCKIQGKDWKYTFECRGEPHTSDDDEYKITVQFTQTCRCLGSRSSGSSEWSDGVTLTVSDKPKVSIIPQNSVFTGDKVTLSCNVGRSAGQMIFWYKDHRLTNAGDETMTLTDVKISDGGQYGCAVKGGTQAPAVNLTVTERPKAAVLVQPDGRVFRGQTVTFTCDIQSSDIIHWSYRWTKDDAVIQGSPSREYRISSVDESHAGNYSCTGSETGGSRRSHTSDELTLTVSGGSDFELALIIGVTSGLSVLFLLIFSLLLLWRCKYKKEAYLSIFGFENKGNFPPPAASSPSTPTKLQYPLHFKTGEGFLSPSTGQQQHNISQTSEEKKREQTQHSDSDVTYAQIEMKTKTERKKNKDKKGKTGETSETIYSKLNIETG